jgi:hypothetical protein
MERTMAHTETECLHCAINKLVEQRLEHAEKGQKIDVTDMASNMAESLADLIVQAAPPEEQGKLLAYTIAHLGEMILQKVGALAQETTH